MAVWAAMASVGAAVGPIFGGWVIETFGWQAAFLMNIPVMVVLLVIGPHLLPESRNPDLHRIDVISVVLSLVGMIGVVYAIKTLTDGKDTDLATSALVVDLIAVIALVRRQLTLPTPLLEVRLFRVRYVRGAVIGDLLSILAMVGALVALVQYLQLVLGLNPLEASVWLIPQAIFAAAAAFAAAMLVQRFLPAYLIAVGLLIAAIGFALSIFLSPTSSPALIATEVDSSTGASVFEIAEGAFTEAITVAGLAGAVIMVLTATWAGFMLRGRPRTRTSRQNTSTRWRTDPPDVRARVGMPRCLGRLARASTAFR